MTMPTEVTMRTKTMPVVTTSTDDAADDDHVDGRTVDDDDDEGDGKDGGDLRVDRNSSHNAQPVLCIRAGRSAKFRNSAAGSSSEFWNSSAVRSSEFRNSTAVPSDEFVNSSAIRSNEFWKSAGRWSNLARACYRCVLRRTVDLLTCGPCQQVFLADFASKFCVHERGRVETLSAADLPDIVDITGPGNVERLVSHAKGPFYRRNLRHKQTRKARQEKRREAGEDFDADLSDHDHLTAPERHRAHSRQRFFERQAAF